MTIRESEHVPSAPAPGENSEGAVDVKTGAATGALTGAFFGASGGLFGLLGGALAGGVVGGLAARGWEHPYVPEYWQERREQLHAHDADHPPRHPGHPDGEQF